MKGLERLLGPGGSTPRLHHKEMKMNNEKTNKNVADTLAKKIIGVEPLSPPDSLKKLLHERYKSLYDGGETGSTRV
jgi:hypothetical protein